MSEKPEDRLIPAVDMRLGGLLEILRRSEFEKSKRLVEDKGRPAVTLSREFGCEAYPVAEQLKVILEKQTGERWVIMDKALLEVVAKNHHLSEEVLKGLGERSRILDEMLSTFSSRWKSEKDYFQLICQQILSLAGKGNVIIVGRGSPIITQSLKNAFHFRLFASPQFKISSISRRLGISSEAANALIQKKQKQRDDFIQNFLNRDSRDLSCYNLIFNNDRNSVDKMAATIADYLRPE